MCVLAIYKAK